jgi:hypothetical protein
MTDDQRKRLTEYLGECWHKGYWYCNCCKEEISPTRVTYQEQCDTCGQYVEWVSNRTFTNWPDLGAVKEKLVEKGDWFRRFKSYAASKWLDDEDEMERYEISDVAAFMVWLFRPIDENGKPHFCRLVAEWLEAKDA